MCSSALPDGVPYDFSVILFCINFFFPGIGTMVSACIADKCEAGTVWVGIFQLITSPILVGWIWAIVWSVNLVKKAKQGEAIKNTAQHAPPVTQPPPVAPHGASAPPQTGVPVNQVPPPPQHTPPPGSYPPPPPPAPQ